MSTAGNQDFESIQDRILVFDREIDSIVVPIAIYDNPIYETITKTFSVQLSLLSGVRTRLTPSVMTVTISEDDLLSGKSKNVPVHLCLIISLFQK